MDALYHARSASRKWGGTPEEYLPVHEWIDESGEHFDDFRHRAMRHHSLGVHAAVEHFGRMLKLSTGREVPIKQIAERHINEDLGFVPTVADWMRHLQPTPWMTKRKVRRIVL